MSHSHHQHSQNYLCLSYEHYHRIITFGEHVKITRQTGHRPISSLLSAEQRRETE